MQRHDAIKPNREERGQRRLGRRGDLEHDHAAAGLHHPRHLGQPALEVGEVARPEADGRGVEAVVGVRELERVAPLPRQLRRLRARALEHALGEVGADHLAAGRDPPRQLDREVAGAGGDVERAVARPQPREVGRALAPAVVQPRRHDRVHEVVEAGDAVEHRADLALLEGARRGGGGAHRATGLCRAAARGSRPARSSSPRAAPVRGHRRGRVLERPPDRRLRQIGRRSSVRCGPGPSLPFSPILWQARQPDWATTSFPASYFLATFMSISFGEPALAPR